MSARGALLLPLLLAGCSSETALLIQIESDLAVPDAVDQLELEAEGFASGQLLNRRFVIESAFPHSFAARPGDNNAEEVTITVTARKRTSSSMTVGDFVAERTVVARFVSGEVRTVRVVLEAACVGIMCPPGQSCVGGMCTSVLPDGGMDGGTPEGGVDSGRDAGPVDGGRDSGPRDGGPDAGPCAAMCEGWSVCGGDGCVDTSNDGRHCGSCGRGCAGTEGCWAGTCAVCAAGYMPCAGRCVDFAVDPYHCGGCDRPCASNQICEAGSCSVAAAGDRCTLPRDLGMATGTTTLALARDMHRHLRPRCLGVVSLRESWVVRWTAPVSATYRFTLRTTPETAMASHDAVIQLYAGGDGPCLCPLAGGCATASGVGTTVQVDLAMTAGQTVRALVGATKAINAELTIE